MDFDTIFDRKGTASLKWDKTEPGIKGVIPLWVADMDFPCMDEITQALKTRAAHPFYGYTLPDPAYPELLRLWYAGRYSLDLAPQDFFTGPGVVPSLGIALRALSHPGDGILLLGPVYYPFYEVIVRNGRKVLEVPLDMNEQGRYRFDRTALEQTLSEAGGLCCPLLFFCSPHNPGGAVWTPEELQIILEFAEDHGLTVVSDEIHGDFVFPPAQFHSVLAFPRYAGRTVVISSASKSFNLGGLHLSHFASRDEKLKTALQQQLDVEKTGLPDIFSLIASKTAYSAGGPWLDELKRYIQINLEETVRYLNAEVPGLRAFLPEGTYLVWADARRLMARKGIEKDTELVRRLETEGRVKLSPGSAFGKRGHGFLRINTACPWPLLTEALDRIAYWANA